MFLTGNDYPNVKVSINPEFNANLNLFQCMPDVIQEYIPHGFTFRQNNSYFVLDYLQDRA